eukprot:1738517-Alexandrium_andersonii.AAC.1
MLSGALLTGAMKRACSAPAETCMRWRAALPGATPLALGPESATPLALGPERAASLALGPKNAMSKARGHRVPRTTAV